MPFISPPPLGASDGTFTSVGRRLDAARKILGMSIGMCPKEKLFRTYIDIELQLGNIDRCRTLYTKYLEWNPSSCSAWSKFAELETSLGAQPQNVLLQCVSPRNLLVGAWPPAALGDCVSLCKLRSAPLGG